MKKNVYRRKTKILIMLWILVKSDKTDLKMAKW